jgi:5-hydroxyisourate hydrolase-like protein (transthyretin family)
MKNRVKTAAIWSLLIIACLLISACGSDSENFVQGNGQIDVTVTNSVTNLPVANVLIQVRKNSVTDPTVVDSWTTDATGKHSFQETIATDYYFTFSATGYTTQNYVNNPVRPELTSTKIVSIAMVPL